MKWYDYLIISISLFCLAFFLLDEHEQRKESEERITQAIEKIEQEQKEIKKAAAIYEAVAKKIINGEW